MKPELLLSVDSEQRFWLDPRTKLYMLVIFSIVMIDGKTDGISFWLKPILAFVPFFLLLLGRRKKGCHYLFGCFYSLMDGKSVSCSIYGGDRNNHHIAASSIWNKVVSECHDGLLSAFYHKSQRICPCHAAYAHTRSVYHSVFCHVPVFPHDFRRSGIYRKCHAYEGNHRKKFF